MLLISCVFSITSIQFKTGCSVCSSWSFCLCCRLLSSIWWSLLVCSLITLDKYLWLWQIPLPLFKSVSPTDLTLEQGGWTTSACKSLCLGSSRPASKQEPSWLSEKGSLLHRRSTEVCFIPGKKWVSLSFCTTIMDMRLLGITLLLLALTLPTADPSANSVAVDSPLAAPSRRGCTGDLACSCRHHHWTLLLVSVLWELLSWDPFQGAFFTISVSDAFSLWTPSDLFSIFH